MSHTQYILYAVPQGRLATQLERYWDDARSKGLGNDAITKYDPHCTLTGFFPATKAEGGYMEDLCNAVFNRHRRADIRVTGLAQGGFDRLTIESHYLREVADEFVQLASVPKAHQKHEQYHVSLRTGQMSKKALKNIQKLQHKIDWKKSTAAWTIALYKKEPGSIKPKKVFELEPQL